jgi:hypothetical protein
VRDRMLESEGGERLPVAAPPRFLARVIQRQQRLEPRGAAVPGNRVARVAFRAPAYFKTTGYFHDSLLRRSATRSISHTIRDSKQRPSAIGRSWPLGSA